MVCLLCILIKIHYTKAKTMNYPVPNTIIDGNGFYVSYNDRDISLYGNDTTALVLGQMAKFLILNGDHRAQYARLMVSGFDACVKYFADNIDKINKRSEAL